MDSKRSIILNVNRTFLNHFIPVTIADFRRFGTNVFVLLPIILRNKPIIAVPFIIELGIVLRFWTAVRFSCRMDWRDCGE